MNYAEAMLESKAKLASRESICGRVGAMTGGFSFTDVETRQTNKLDDGARRTC